MPSSNASTTNAAKLRVKPASQPWEQPSELGLHWPARRDRQLAVWILEQCSFLLNLSSGTEASIVFTNHLVHWLNTKLTFGLLI